jgi:2-dehydro-3-deoxyphosphogluconate aldolase/(4S)-4-hydroxy-2-oxoglutarate aldolase
MPKLEKSIVVEKIKASGMVPVYNHPDLDVCKAVLKACYDGGLRVFEFTNRSESAVEVFVELKRYTSDTIPDMLIGVGSIIDAETTRRFIAEGADFIVSPALVEEMAMVCKQNKVPWLPGCGTVTEVVKAHQLGADIIKLFPGAQVGGPGFVKAVLAPLPFLDLMPTGGVSPDKENLQEWFTAGVACVGMGSKLFPKDWIEAGKLHKLSQLISRTLEVIREVRD